MNKKLFKNYLILLAIFILTFVICLYLFSWVKQYNDVRIGEPIITTEIREVKYNNLDSLLKENELVVMYTCTTTENVCRSFEKTFKTYIKDNNLDSKIVYYNLGFNNVVNNSLERLYNKYKSDNLIKKIDSYPVIFIFKQGKIIDFLDYSNNFNISLVDEFLEGYDLSD